MRPLLEKVMEDFQYHHDLEVQEAITNDTLYKTPSYQAIIDMEINNSSNHGGYNILGSGAYAYVVEYPGYSEVVKIMINKVSDPACNPWNKDEKSPAVVADHVGTPYYNLTYFIWNAMNSDKPYDPNVDTMASYLCYDQNKSPYVILFIVMEKLKPIDRSEHHNANRFVKELTSGMPDRFDLISYGTKTKSSYRDFVKKCKTQGRAPKLVREYRKFVWRQSFLTHYGVTIDITHNNVMLRGDQVVMTDPYF